MTNGHNMFELAARNSFPKHESHDPLRGRDPSSNRSVWAKGDLNPHVPKDTGT